MAYDRRFPFVVPLDSSSLPGDVKRCAREVCRRTGTGAFHNARFNTVFFTYNGDATGGPAQCLVRDCRTSADADDLVHRIQLCKVSRFTKDRWAASHKRNEEHESQKAQDAMLEDRRPSALDRAQFLDRKRRGTQSAVVAL